MSVQTLSVAIAGSGGAGALTAGHILLDAAARAGYYGIMARTAGPQIRGGESATLIRLGSEPVNCLDDHFDLLLALDWKNIERFVDEIPLDESSTVICDGSLDDVPDDVLGSSPGVAVVDFKGIAKRGDDLRANMIALGLLAALIEIPEIHLAGQIAAVFKDKGSALVRASQRAASAGYAEAAGLDLRISVPEKPGAVRNRSIMSGSEASGLGVLLGGVKFAAAYPITPASEMLEYLAPRLKSCGGCLLQAEDELASINMVIGASFGGCPSFTATSGPGFALMTEGIGLAVASETPVVVTNVMRGGPSTGIPTKSEQSDLNIAVYGLHGEAPHLVLAPMTVGDCTPTHQWAVELAETLQTAAVVLSDQNLAQTRSVMDQPRYRESKNCRLLPTGDKTSYLRYENTATGVSAMSIPGAPSVAYTAEGLEHQESGKPSTANLDHITQMGKRQRKLEQFAYGDRWIEAWGRSDTVIITWGSCWGAVCEAAQRLEKLGVTTRVVGLRLLLPARPDAFHAILDGATRLFVVEHSHGRQFYQYLKAHYRIPDNTRVLAQPGPLPIRPQKIVDFVVGSGLH